MTSNQNGMGLVASFLPSAIACILHVAILHLATTVSSRRSADGTSQGQQTVHPPTPLIGVTSENSEVVEVTSERPSEHEIPSASLHERTQLVPRKGTAGKLSQDEVIATFLATFLREEIYVSPKYEKTNLLKDEGHEIITRFLSELSLAVSRKDLVGRDSNDDIVYAQKRIARINYVISTKPKKSETSRDVTPAIETLPQEILLEIFDVYRLDSLKHSQLGGRPWAWHRLAHVCQRWRDIIFASSRYLDLKVFCTYGTPVREILSSSLLNLPIIVRYGGFPGSSLLTADDEDGIIALLDHPSRICEVQLTTTAPLLEMAAAPMQQPFSVLEYLHLSTRTGPGLVLPSEFGGTPRLRILRMVGVALPALPKFLLSAQDLVSLQLEELPSIGYTLDALRFCLPEMTRLKTLRIHFLSPSSRPALASTLQSPESHPVLHYLNYIEFHGASEYLESLLSTISAPFLKYIHMALFNQLIFHTPQFPQLSQFILRTETQRSPTHATIHCSVAEISVTLSKPGIPHHLALRILCKDLDWQISSMAELCEGLSPTLSRVEQLNISATSTFSPGGQDEMDLTQLEFPDLFRQFINVKRLFITGGSVWHVAGSLGPITGQLAVTVLPALREIYVRKHAELAPAQSGLAPFIGARDHSAHSVAIRSLESDPDQNPQPPSDRGHTTPTGSRTSRIRGSDPAVVPEIGVRDIREHLRRNPHLFAIRSLFQLVPYYQPLISQSDNEEASENLAEFSQDLLDMHPGQESEVKLLQRLAHSPAFTSQLPGRIAQIVSIPAVVRRNDMVVMYERLSTAWWWATFARMWAHSSTTVAYQNTLSALRDILVAGLTTRLLYTFFGRLGPRLHVPLEYSSYLLERGRLELAVEAIEHGKALIWSEMFGLYPSMGRLRSVNPNLADRLARFTEGLEAIETSGAQEDADTEAFSLAFEKLQELLKGRQEVFQQIRALPGFANFMKDIPFRTLRNAAAQGPIIIINHCHWRCDILIILHNSPPSLIPTNEGFYELASNLESRLKDARRYHGVDSIQYATVLADTLAALYELVGRPVISRLQDLGIQEQSRIWWYPTSVFCSLPLHAMGPVPSTDGHERYFSDMYVCSYTPTLGALIQSQGSPALNPDPQHSLLLVAQPEDSLPGVRGEMKIVQGLQIPVTTLSSAEVTKTAVLENLKNHTLAHFACHGNLGEEGPLESEIQLPGGGRLTLRDIVNSQLPLGEVVFLSTCHTAGSTDVDDPTEGLNIAAAMQYQVFRSVIGTMWEMADTDGRDISKFFYRYLLAHRDESHGVPLGERSARALQKAVRAIRRKRGVTLDRWVNWVHYGARK
ncbi:CHAT domain-containing protein [Lactarius sanguifluus]|nr:CHAT domain-containing protein [Lactarius sanguifluus]